MGWPEIMIWGGNYVLLSLMLTAAFLDKEKEDYGTSWFAALFIMGAIFAVLIGARLLIWGW